MSPVQGCAVQSATTEDEFPFASGIGRHDYAVAFREHIVDDFELFCGGDVRHQAPVGTDLANHKPERVGNHGKAFGRCAVVAVCARHGERHEVPERPCHHVAVAGRVTLFAYVGADDTGDVLPDTRRES